MKYFAILKDSFREALDSKVLYVLIGLSTIVTGFVATLSFKSLPAQRTMEQFFFTPKTMPLVIALNSSKPEKNQKDSLDKTIAAMTQFQLHKVEQLSGETDSPEGTYALTIRPQQGKATPEGIKSVRGLFEEVIELGYFEVDIRHVADDPPHYLATLKGTARTNRIWAARPSLFFGAVPVGEFAAPLGYQIYILTALVLSFGSWAAVLMSVVITSFFIPNMLRKGTVDLLLVKPIHRWALLLYKYIGGLTFIFLSTAYAMGGLWLVVGLRSGLWANWTLLLVFTITFFFMILYAISTFVGVMTRSTVTAIMVTIGAWFVFFVIGTTNKIFHDQWIIEEAKMKGNANLAADDEGWGHGPFAQATFAVHTITPRTSDLSYLNDLIVKCDLMTGSLDDMQRFDTTQKRWWESVLVSAIWMSVFLGAAMIWFTYKDY